MFSSNIFQFLVQRCSPQGLKFRTFLWHQSLCAFLIPRRYSNQQRTQHFGLHLQAVTSTTSITPHTPPSTGIRTGKLHFLYGTNSRLKTRGGQNCGAVPPSCQQRLTKDTCRVTSWAVQLHCGRLRSSLLFLARVLPSRYMPVMARGLAAPVSFSSRHHRFSLHVREKPSVSFTEHCWMQNSGGLTFCYCQPASAARPSPVHRHLNCFTGVTSELSKCLEGVTNKLVPRENNHPAAVTNTLKKKKKKKVYALCGITRGATSVGCLTVFRTHFKKK